MDMPLAATLRDRRRALGLRQSELAELAGVSTRFIGEVENGKQTIRLDKLQALLEVLGLTMELKLRVKQGS
jgi:HTH-type transcriptional regulator/antitoxin HipB